MEDCVERSNRSPRVCLNCKERKRKCDKTLPACSRCDRLLLRCRYESTDSSTDDDASSPLRLISSKFGSWTSWVRNFYLLMQKKSLGSEDFVSTYFVTVHKWLPIIDEKRFTDRLEHHFYKTDINDFLLLTSLYLIVRRPDEQPHLAAMNDDLYQAVRHFYFHIFAGVTCSSPSIQFLQSGLLLATYEYGHGLVNAAHATLFSCLSASMSLGLHLTKAPLNMNTEWKCAMKDESTLIWWAIVVADRIICASSITNPRLPATKIIDEANFLSDLEDTGDINDDRLSWDRDAYAATNFYRQVQSSALLGHVLDLVNATDPFSQDCQTRFRELDSQLQRAIQINLQAETKFKLNSVSEALSINRSAFLLLHRWQYDHSETMNSDTAFLQSRMAIESVISITLETIRDFLPRIRGGWFKSHHPQGVQSVFLAAIALTYLDPSDNTKVEEMKEMMRVQSRRWNIAVEYLRIIQEKQQTLGDRARIGINTDIS